MRQIKFRAWDELNKVMHNDFQFIKSGDSGNDWIIFKSNRHECFDRWVNNPYFSQQMKIMQFVGMKDNSGKQIYEGDVCRQKFSDEITIGDVRIEATRGAVLSGHTPCWPHDIEVIGNIYENPELLK